MTASILHTTRLALHPLTRVDIPALFPMFADAETMRFMPMLPHRSVAESEDALGEELEVGARYWTIRMTPGGPLIGYIGFLGQTLIPGMGYMLRREYWGKGITTEAATAVLDHAFTSMGLSQAELWINERNIPSQRVAAKLGFTLQGRIAQKYAHENDHHIMLVYGCWAAEWQLRRADSILPAQKPAPYIFRNEPVLLVPNLQETLAFYTQKLGFKITFLFGDPLEHAGIALGHWTSQGIVMQLAQGDPQQPFKFSGWFYIFVDTRLDELYATMSASGVQVLREPRDYPWGMREFAICDNNGLQLRFGTQL